MFFHLVQRLTRFAVFCSCDLENILDQIFVIYGRHFAEALNSIVIV